MKQNIQFIFLIILLSHITLGFANISDAKVRSTFHTNTRGEQIIVFISFSMPEASLKKWLIDAQKIGASVVVRGLMNNSFQETIQAFAKLTDEDTAMGIQINPELFQTYGIEQVPAVVVTQNGSASSYDVIQGNTTLRYALETLATQGELNSAYVKNALAKLGGMHA